MGENQHRDDEREDQRDPPGFGQLPDMAQREEDAREAQRAERRVADQDLHHVLPQPAVVAAAAERDLGRADEQVLGDR